MAIDIRIRVRIRINGFILLCLFYLAAWARNERLIIAVNDLNPIGVDSGAAQVISDRIRAELIAANIFRVMERAEMEEVLREQGFQASGACDEKSCLVEIGKLLGIDHMVSGSIGKVDDFFTIFLRMINIKTGEILFTVSEDFEGDLKGVVLTSAVASAQKLISLSQRKASNACVLEISSTPSGALIILDTSNLGNTPFSSSNIEPGTYQLSLQMKNHTTISEDIVLGFTQK